jgi:uncharacterized protein DUF2752
LARPSLPVKVAGVDEPALPLIYTTRRADPARLPPAARLVALGMALACLTVLCVAAWATPNPSGVGTHASSLHMQPCHFLQTTGLPCPGCGMTTSFAWFVRGKLVAAVYVQPMGAALAALSAMAVWAGLYVALTGRPVYRLFRLLPGRYYLLPLLALGLAAWGWKILLRLNGWDGWR